MKRQLLAQRRSDTCLRPALDLLLVLIEARHQVVTKDELMQRVWSDAIVEENNLTVAMSGLRKALGEEIQNPRYIVTVPGRGYRFIAEVRTDRQSLETQNVDEECVQPAAGKSDSDSPPDGAKIGSGNEVAARRPKSMIPSWLAILIVTAIVLGSAYLALTHYRRTKQSLTSIRSVAVLPFNVIGAGEEDRYLGTGVADAITAKLSGNPQLAVRPTRSVLRYSKPDVNPVSAGQELGVDAVLDGEIQRLGNRVRVTVELVSVRDGTTMWADKLEQDFSGIFAVEDSISAGASEHLLLHLSAADRQRLSRHITENPEAYQAYMKGRYFWDKDTEQPMLKSIGYFEQAIFIDPNFARAYVGIADAYTDLVIQGYVAGANGLPKVKEAALAALKLDPTLAEPHNSLGVVAWGLDRDWTTAGQEFNRATELNPESIATHSDRAFYLMTLGRTEESIAEAQKAVALSPASSSLNTTVGYAYFAAQRYEDSAIWLRKALDLDPGFSFPRALLAVDLALAGEHAEAMAEIAKIHDVASSGADPLVSALAAYACAISGARAAAQGILLRLKNPPADRYVDPYTIAIVFSGLGDDQATLAWLDTTIRQRSLSAVFFNFDPFFSRFHSNVRFQQLEKMAGIPN